MPSERTWMIANGSVRRIEILEPLGRGINQLRAREAIRLVSSIVSNAAKPRWNGDARDNNFSLGNGKKRGQLNERAIRVIVL